MTDAEQEQVKRDRRALIRGAIGAGVAGLGAYALLKKGRGGVVREMPKWQGGGNGLPRPLPPAPVPLTLRQRVALRGPRNQRQTLTKPVIQIRGQKIPKGKVVSMRSAAIQNNLRKGGTPRLVKAADIKAERAYGALKPPTVGGLGKLSPQVRAEYAKLDDAARKATVKPKPGLVTASEQKQAEQGARLLARKKLQAYRKKKNFQTAATTMIEFREPSENPRIKVKRDGLSKARDAALLAGGLGVLGASGYAGLRAHKLYKVASKAIPKEARKLRRTAEGAMRAVKEELPAVRKATDVTQKAIQDAANRAKDSADSVVNSTAVYSDVGKIYKSAKGGLGNLLNPRRTLRETKAAFRSGYNSGRYGKPDTFIPEPRKKWELHTPARGLLHFAELTQEEMERLYGKKWERRKMQDGKIQEKKKGLLFETPASRVIEFGGYAQAKVIRTRRYANPLMAVAGLQDVYTQVKPDGTPIPEDMPVAHGQVLRSVYRQGKKIQRTATRGGSMAKDVVDVVRGKPRQKDAAGRLKKREWEKSWFRDGVKNVAAGSALLGGAVYLRKNPKVRDRAIKAGRKAAKWANEKVPDIMAVTGFETEDVKTQDARLKSFATPAAALFRKIERPLRKGPLGKFMGPSGSQRAALEARKKLLDRVKAKAAAGDPKAGFTANRVARNVKAKESAIKSAERQQKDAIRGVKRAAKIAGAGALAGGAAMKLHADQPEKRKVQQGARFRNALVGAAAGSMLGGGLGGGRSGYKGARVGAALGGLIGAVSNPKRKQVIEDLPMASFAETEDGKTQDARLKSFEKRFKKVVVNPETGRKRTVRYGQAGKAADGKDRIRPGTSKGDAYCARSAKIPGDWRNDPNSPNSLSRKKWRCEGSKSKRFEQGDASMEQRENSFQTPASRILGLHAPGSRLHAFDEVAADAGWDVRDPRGRSARVFAPGARRRERRPKEWHEKTENERKLWQAGLVAAGAAGVLGGAAIGRRFPKRKPKAMKAPKPGKVVQGPWMKHA